MIVGCSTGFIDKQAVDVEHGGCRIGRSNAYTWVDGTEAINIIVVEGNIRQIDRMGTGIDIKQNSVGTAVANLDVVEHRRAVADVDAGARVLDYSIAYHGIAA